MLRLVFAILVGLMLAVVLAEVSYTRSRFGESLSTLESRLSNLQEEKARIAPVTFRGGIGNIWWESIRRKTADHREWVEVQLPDDYLIDEIVLVPVLWRGAKGVVQADGFPVEFNIRIGIRGDDVGTQVASFNETDALLPRDTPVAIPIQPTRGNWIRVEATKLSPRQLDDQFLFQLSEIMVFSGAENVALRGKLKVSSTYSNRAQRTNRTKSLVDGFTPYLMTSAEGKGSQSFISTYRFATEATLTFDLKQKKQIDRINIHAAYQPENVPQIQESDYGMPNYFIIEGANTADFSDAKRLFQYRKKTIYDAGPILMCRFDPCDCRFVRLTAIDAFRTPGAIDTYRSIGFGEIEVFEGNQNVAAGVLPVTNIVDQSWKIYGRGKKRSLKALTDGLNNFGPIIPNRKWVEQLARQHDLKAEISLIETELKERYASRGRYFRRAMGLIALLTIAIIGTALISRSFNIKELNRLKKRFAADLHDEVGADLHAIALLSDLAKAEQNAPKQLLSILGEIRTVSQDASASVRHVANAQTAAPYAKLPRLMRQVAARILIGIEHQIDIEGVEHIESLRPQTRADLLSFFKECLVNVSRHAEATTLETTLKVDSNAVRLTIQDNGRGIEDSEADRIPPSLVRRAKLLGAKIESESSAENGTRINLQFNRKQWNHFKKR